MKPRARDIEVPTINIFRAFIGGNDAQLRDKAAAISFEPMLALYKQCRDPT